MCGQRMYAKFMTVDGTRKDSSEELHFFLVRDNSGENRY